MKSINIPCIMLCFILLQSCKKDYLDAKPDNALAVPSTLQDLQALMDDDRIMNGSSNQNIGGPNPALLVEGCDDFYVTDDLFNNCSLYSKNVYVWAKENTYGGNTSILDWSSPYRAVYYANITLDGLSKIQVTSNNAKQWNNLKGSALFYRAHTFYQLAQAFAPDYDKSNASNEWGLPLKLTSDVNEKLTRASVVETYKRIIQDLQNAEPLLPVTPVYKTRPSKPAVFALLARVYQTMEDYNDALLFADSCLYMVDTLIDFNSLDTAATYPLNLFNSEVIFASTIQDNPTELYYSSQAAIDTILYASYKPQDLRKTIFFFKNGTPERIYFRGSYDGSGYPFMGIATDEIYFIKAECLARKGDINNAMKLLNSILRYRYKTGLFTSLTATNADDALDKILKERRKELLMRGLRWTDLRRLNKDQRFAKTLIRYINEQTYTLPPNDVRYTWPIPVEVISLNPGMPQNPR